MCSLHNFMNTSDASVESSSPKTSGYSESASTEAPIETDGGYLDRLGMDATHTKKQFPAYEATLGNIHPAAPIHVDTLFSVYNSIALAEGIQFSDVSPTAPMEDTLMSAYCTRDSVAYNVENALSLALSDETLDLYEVNEDETLEETLASQLATPSLANIFNPSQSSVQRINLDHQVHPESCHSHTSDAYVQHSAAWDI